MKQYPKNFIQIKAEGEALSLYTDENLKIVKLSQHKVGQLVLIKRIDIIIIRS